MSEKELVKGEMGSMGSYEVEFKDGKLVATAMAAAADGLIEAGLTLKLDAGKVITAIEKAIPGQLDDAVLEVLKAALLK